MAAWSDHTARRTRTSATAPRLRDVRSDTLRATIARLAAQDRSTGPMAQACRHELTRRGEST